MNVFLQEYSTKIIGSKIESDLSNFSPLRKPGSLDMREII